jgi:hypothetical protein
MARNKIPHWMPNWRDDEAYPASFDDWSLAQWVWAFLRRNDEYRSDYEKFAALPDVNLEGGKTSKWSGRSACQDDDMSLRYANPAALIGEAYCEYWKRIGNDGIDEMPLESYLMEKWGVVHLPNPDMDDGFQLIGSVKENLPYLIQINATDPLPEPDRPEHVTLRFDLRHSIDVQLAEAKLFLQEQLEYASSRLIPIERIQASGARNSELPKYLRAFDAALVGAKASEFGPVLYPEKAGAESADAMKAAANRAVRAGKALVDGGYRSLLTNH